MMEISNQGDVAILKMNHGKVNAIDTEFCHEMQLQLERLAAGDCRAVVLTSATKVFSAGVDLVRFLKEDSGYVNPFLDALEECFRCLFEFPKPIVAAINGHAVAGGCVLAAACDYRLIKRGAKIGVPELRVGVPFPPIALEIMRLVASPQAFQSMVNIGATYQDEAAVRVGLADCVRDVADLSESSLETANQLTTIPADVFFLTKQHIRMMAIAQVNQAEQEFGHQIRELWNSSEIRDMIQSYVGRKLSK